MPRVCIFGVHSPRIKFGDDASRSRGQEQPLGLTCIKRTKGPPLFQLQSLLIGNTLYWFPLHWCWCAGSSWFEQRARRILSVIAPRYEEAACIKAAMTPFWSGHSTHPPISSCLPGWVGASPLPIVFLCNMLMARMRMMLIRMIGVIMMVVSR